VANLGNFDGGASPVTSVYLGLESATEARKTVLLRFKDLVSEHADRLFADRSHAEKAAIRADIDKVNNFLATLPKVDMSGLAIFSCSDKNFFETIGMPDPFRPQLIVSRRPAVAPLVAALEDYKRIAVCIVDRRNARLYEYFTGRMEEISAFSDDVPGRTKVAGWAGWQESRIARSVERREVIHLKNAAEVLFEQFRLRGFDWLFLAVRPELREPFENVLHTHVRDRLKGFIEATMVTPADEVRTKTMALAEKLKNDEDLALVTRVIETASAAGPAVAGLQKTLEALNLAAVSTLVVRAGASKKGVFCSNCGLLGIKRADCSSCGRAVSQADNIIHVAEEAAMAQGATIRHLKRPSPLDDYDGIGALTRFPVKNGTV